MAFPVAVRLPARAQELDPVSAPIPSTPTTSGMLASILDTWVSGPTAARSCSRVRAEVSGRAEVRVAFGSNARPTTVPRVTIGSKPSTG